jgi:hypothetical protein
MAPVCVCVCVCVCVLCVCVFVSQLETVEDAMKSLKAERGER